MLLATEKYANKTEQVLKAGLQREPLFNIRQKLKEGARNESVQLEDSKQSAGGMMLYTSGTTNRPVGAFIIHHLEKTILNPNRKESSSPTLQSQHKQLPFFKHGNTHPKTDSSTSFHSTTSTAW